MGTHLHIIRQHHQGKQIFFRTRFYLCNELLLKGSSIYIRILIRKIKNFLSWYYLGLKEMMRGGLLW